MFQDWLSVIFEFLKATSRNYFSKQHAKADWYLGQFCIFLYNYVKHLEAITKMNFKILRLLSAEKKYILHPKIQIIENSSFEFLTKKGNSCICSLYRTAFIFAAHWYKITSKSAPSTITVHIKWSKVNIR